jgi:hypothetical protein
MTQKELLDRLESDLKDLMELVRPSLSGSQQIYSNKDQRPNPGMRSSVLRI